MVRLLPVASGKGGVGKSVLVANLGTALARLGKTVVVVDLDLGGSNLHTCLGIRNSAPGIGALVWRHEKSLSALLVETGIERLWLVPGDNLLPASANLEWHAKTRLLRDIGRLPADYVVLDLGAGSAYNVVDFFTVAPAPLLVLIPEITSTLNAYSLLKTAAFRILQRSFPERGLERAELMAFAGSRLEGTGRSFLEFARELAERHPEVGGAGLERLRRLAPRVVMNRGRSSADVALGYRLRDIASRNLGFRVRFEGFLLEDPALPPSVGSRHPLLVSGPEEPFSRGVTALAARLVAEDESTRGQAAGGMEPLPFEGEGPEPDLDALAAEALGGS